MAEITYTLWERAQIIAIEARGLKRAAAIGYDARTERDRTLKRLQDKARRRAANT